MNSMPNRKKKNRAKQTDTMKFSRYYFHDRQAATVIPRLMTAAASLVGAIISGFSLTAHRDVSRDDNIDKVYTLLPLIFFIYGAFWSLSILIYRRCDPHTPTHPAISLTFDLIAMGTILGSSIAKLAVVFSYDHEYDCSRYQRQCNGAGLMIVDKAASVIGVIDSVIFLLLFVMATSACVRLSRGYV